MNELKTLVEWSSQPDLTLATVVETQGSAYRRAGAHMLVGARGPLTGSVSGGCLEADIVERALDLREPQLVTYDTLSPSDIVWGLGLGCQGVVQVLLEPLDPQLVDWWRECLETRQATVIATVYRSGDGFPVGRRWRLGPDFPGALEEDALQALNLGRSLSRHYGSLSVLLEVVKPPQPLLICGAGPDAVPLARMAHELGWEVTVIDRRPAYARREIFPMADRVEVFEDVLEVDERSAAVVMAHNAAHDRDYLRHLLNSPVPYIGVLGPRKRTRQFLDELGAQDDRVYYPVGLDLGAETPAEIALAILAEIQAVQAGRRGVCLRGRPGPIHELPVAVPV